MLTRKTSGPQTDGFKFLLTMTQALNFCLLSGKSTKFYNKNPKTPYQLSAILPGSTSIRLHPCRSVMFFHLASLLSKHRAHQLPRRRRLDLSVAGRRDLTSGVRAARAAATGSGNARNRRLQMERQRRSSDWHARGIDDWGGLRGPCRHSFPYTVTGTPSTRLNSVRSPSQIS